MFDDGVMKNDWSRRNFLSTVLASLPAATLLQRGAAAAPPAQSPPVCVFSKHLEFLHYEDLAKTCRELGLDGVDLTVRDGGHVRPERVTRDLPRAVEAIRAEGLEVPMITTRLNRGDDPDAEPILKTAGGLGIRYFRVGGHSYDKREYPLEQLKGFTKQLQSLAVLAERYGMVAGYHNHSGYGRVGAPVWDLLRMYEAIDSGHLGSNFDLGHATVEGAYGDWRITARVMAPHVKMVAVKDFRWEGNRPEWVPLGRGVVQISEFLSIFREAGFAGPIDMHFEYDTESREALLDDIGDAAKRLRREMERAGYDV